jgi:uncharacterized damage-inducible protein DinB
MISPAWLQMMAAYNAEMNRRVFAAASGLDDVARKQDRGAFWGSIHGTLCHLLWADRIWMHRFDGWPKPAENLRESASGEADFGRLSAARAETDGAIEQWAARVPAGWLAAEQTWFSGAAQRQVSRSRGLLVTHLFNHQTHHRGQVHAMLTAAGASTGDTDLFIVLQE